MLREYKAESVFLEGENKKIRKTLKYIKINELEIELKVVIEENQQLAAVIEKYGERLNRSERLATDNEDLEGAL